jgi:hypothetical protein
MKHRQIKPANLVHDVLKYTLRGGEVERRNVSSAQGILETF